MTVARTSLITLCLALAACKPLSPDGLTKPYHVLHESGPPSALADVESMTLRWDFSIMMLGTQTPAEYQGHARTDEDQQQYDRVMYALTAGFTSSLPRWTGDTEVRQGPGEVLLTVVPIYLRPGTLPFMSSEPTELALRCRWSRDGELLDEIEIETRVEPSRRHPTAVARVAHAARQLSRICGTYVKRSR